MRLLCTLHFLLLVLAATQAHADPAGDSTERAREHVKLGIDHYGNGRYDDAAREMEAAYALKALPDLQYNLAQCYERLNRLTEAAVAYRKYLDGKSDADDRDAVEARITNLQGRARQQQAGAPAPPPPTEKVVFKTIVVYREAPPKPGRGARFAAYGLGVVAIGAAAAGVSFAVLAKLDSNQVSQGGSLTLPLQWSGDIAATESAGRNDVIVSYVSFGVAAVAAVGAVGLFVLGERIDREAPKLSLAPSLSPHFAGLAAAGSF